MEQGGDNSEIYPAKPSAKRESHRPSFEVVEVEIKSFYDKGDFKRDLQVGRKRVGYTTECVVSVSIGIAMILTLWCNVG